MPVLKPSYRVLVGPEGIPQPRPHAGEGALDGGDGEDPLRQLRQSGPAPDIYVFGKHNNIVATMSIKYYYGKSVDGWYVPLHVVAAAVSALETRRVAVAVAALGTWALAATEALAGPGRGGTLGSYCP